MRRLAVWALLPVLSLIVAPAAARGQENLLDAIDKVQSKSAGSIIQELGTSLKRPRRTVTRVNKRQTRGYRKYFLKNGDMLLDQVQKTKEGSTVVTRTHIQRQLDGKYQAHHLLSAVLKGKAMTGYTSNGTMFHAESNGFGGFRAPINIQHLTRAENAKRSIQDLNREMQRVNVRTKWVKNPWKPLGRLAKTISSWNARHKMPRAWHKAQRRAPKKLTGRR